MPPFKHFIACIAFIFTIAFVVTNDHVKNFSVTESAEKMKKTIDQVFYSEAEKQNLKG